MKEEKISFTCDNCGRPAFVDLSKNRHAEPRVTYESWRYTDAAGSGSTASNSIHLCAHCTRKWLSLILCERKTVKQAQEHFRGKDKQRVPPGGWG